MSSQTLSKQLLNSRARVFFAGASGWISGWVYDVALPDLWISASAPLPQHSTLTMAVQSDRTSVHFSARLLEADREETLLRKAPVFVGRGATIAQPKQYCYHMTIVSGVRHVPNKQGARKALHEFQGLLQISGEEIPVQIADISTTGAGIYANLQFPVGMQVTLLCSPGETQVLLPAIVQHSRQLPANEALFATGLHFDGVSRIDQARWKNRFHEAHVQPSRNRRFAGAEIQPLPDADVYAAGIIETLNQANDLLERMAKVHEMERHVLLKYVEELREMLEVAENENVRSQLDVFMRHGNELQSKLVECLDSLRPGETSNAA